MVTKLTLSAEEEIVKRAKQLASDQKTSVSALFDRFVRATTETPRGHRNIGRLTRKATGIISLPLKKSDRQHIEEALMKKYGIK